MGKPMLAQVPNFYFNISHTHFAIAISISDNETGVDIERIKKHNHELLTDFFQNTEVIM